MKTSPLLLSSILVLGAACGGGSGDDARDATPDAGADAASTADASLPDALPCGVAPSYAGAAVPVSGIFDVEYDDNGPGAGDPLPGNDALFASGRLNQAMPSEALFVELYEGYTQFTDKGGIRDFASFELPLVLDIGASPDDQDYGSCGACFSLFPDATFAPDGTFTSAGTHLFPESGTVTITALPTEPDQVLTLSLDNVRLTERDDSGVAVVGGCTTTLDGVTLSVTTAAIAPAKRGDLPLGVGRGRSRSPRMGR